jgi:hypothetical protein
VILVKSLNTADEPLGGETRITARPMEHDYSVSYCFRTSPNRIPHSFANVDSRQHNYDMVASAQYSAAPQRDISPVGLAMEDVARLVALAGNVAGLGVA